MTVRTYPAYRESGVNWLGSIPNHWMVRPLRQFATLTGGGTPNRDTLHYWNGDIPWVSPKDMKSELISKSEEYITEDGLTAGAASLVEDYSILMVVRSGILKHTIPVALNTLPVTLNQDMKAIRLAPAVGDPRFFVRLIQGFNQPFLDLWSKQGATVESLETAAIRATVVPCPPLIEQSAIVVFLDRETGKIDALMAEQERLISLLKEKRQAVISQAVTKGLDPNVPMRDSGVEWFGEVPAHWEVVPLMWLTQVSRPIMYGIVLPGPDVGEGVPILKGGNVKPPKMTLDSMARTTPEIEAPYARARLMMNDLVYSIRGSIGDCEIVPKLLEGSNITQDVARIAPDQSVDPEWLRFALLAKPLQEELACGSLGAAVRGINICDLKRVRVPVPPSAERCQITNYVRKSISQLERLGSEATQAITLLRERRAALISAAVTGKIDVRDTIAQLSAQAA